MSGVEPSRSSQPGGSRERLIVGVMSPPGPTHDLAEKLARQLPAKLQSRHPEFEWRVETDTDVLAGAGGVGADLLDLARHRQLERGWRFTVCLTDLPLYAGRRPVIAQASVILGVGLVSVPALGIVELERRAQDAVVRVIETLLRGDASQSRGRRRDERHAIRERMSGRIQDMQALSSPLGLPDVPEEQTVRYVTATGRGNARLVVGMVRGNRPWRFVIGLSGALIAALGTSAFGLTSPAVWRIADAMGRPRLTLLAVGAVLTVCTTIIVSHRLWERSPSPGVRDQVSLINLATAITVLLGVLTLFAALFVITSICDLALIAPRVLAVELHHPVAYTDYLRVAWVVSSIATIGGALGAATESDLTVREAAYGFRPTEQTQSEENQAEANN
jgi:hypothetical protein